ncbi:MAG: WD40 repeat domain-containing protein, partial [Phycisphaerae bacterium]
DGTTLVVGDVDGTIHLLDLLGDVPLRSWSAHDGPVLALAFAPDGRRFVSGGADWRVRLWRLGETEPLGEWQHDEWVNALAFSTDGSRIASGGAFLNIHLGRPEAQPDRLIPSAHAHWINGLAFVKRGRVLISGGNDAAVRFWDADSGQELATLTSHGGPVHTIDVSDDGRYLAVGAVNAVQLIDLEASASLIPTAEAVGAERD